jgi:hypothetical protein
MGVVDVVPACVVSDVGIWIALMTGSTRDSIMKIYPIAHTAQRYCWELSVLVLFPAEKLRKKNRQFPSSGFSSPVFDMFLLFTTSSIPLLDAWSYRYTTLLSVHIVAGGFSKDWGMSDFRVVSLFTASQQRGTLNSYMPSIPFLSGTTTSRCRNIM